MSNLKTLALIVALLLTPVLAAAQSPSFFGYHFPGGGAGGTWDGGAFATPAEGPDGCANPAYGFGVTDTDAGFCLSAANSLIGQTSASGGSRGVFLLNTTTAAWRYYNAGSAISSFEATDDTATIYTNGLGRLRLTNTSGNFLNIDSVVFGSASAKDPLQLTPVALGAGSSVGTFTSADLTAARSWTAPDATGDVAVIASTGFPVRTGVQAWSTRCLAAGTGVTIAEACGQAGNITVSIDTAVVNTFSSGTGDVPGTGAVGTSYAETDALSMYDYPATDTEHWRLTIAAGQTAGRLFQTSGTDVLAEITPIDETVIVSNGTTWEKKTLPDCDDAGGNHLNYDTATNVFSCGTSGGGSFDPSTTVALYEEFNTGDEATAGEIGTLGWYQLPISTGTISEGTAYAEHPGVRRLSSHATNDNSGTILNLASSSANTIGTPSFLTLANNDWSLDTVILPGANSTAITNAGYYFGFVRSISAAGADPVAGSGAGGIWIRYDTDHSDATYIFQICNASGVSGCGDPNDGANSATVASTITPVAGTWNRLRIRRAASGVGGNPTIYFRVNDEAEKTFCSATCDDTLGTLDTSAVLGFISFVYLTRTTTGVLSGEIDYVNFTMSGLTRY